MKWIGISGSWRTTNPQVEADVHQVIREIISRGDGIITGGALGVDSYALAEALALDSTAQKIKVIIPTSLSCYSAHYRRRAQEGVITSTQAEELITLLITLKQVNSLALVENENTHEVNAKSYYQRNSQVVASSDELWAFQVNHSSGTQDTIDKAKQKGILVNLKAY